jgi:23S rRNA (cytidine2498-2'-O)-methyltransferase
MTPSVRRFCPMSTVFIHCRSGFEKEAGEEISMQAEALGVPGEVDAQPNRGYTAFNCGSLAEAERLLKQVDFGQLIFARQWFAGIFLYDLYLYLINFR